MAEKQQTLIKSIDETPREVEAEDAGVYQVDITAEETAGDEVRVEFNQTPLSANVDNPPWADKHPPAPAVVQEDPIFRLAEKGVSMEQLEKLIAMRDREREYQAKRDFDLHFAEMQQEFSELGPASKTVKGDKGMYADIRSLVKHYGTAIAYHKFSFRFYEKTLEDGRLEVFMDISGHGHTVTNSKVLPVYEPDKGGQSGKPIMNVLQAEGTRSTYGQRYVFVAGFGVVSENEDTDGALTFDAALKYSEEIKALQAETNIETLNTTAKGYYDELKAKKDHEGADTIKAVYKHHKEALEKKEKTNADN